MTKRLTVRAQSGAKDLDQSREITVYPAKSILQHVPTSSEDGSQKTRASQIAVVIPIYAQTMEHMQRFFVVLDALHSTQTQAPDFIVIVDDASPLKVPSIFSSAHVKVMRLHENTGPAAARNYGLRESKRLGARMVCFLDADCEPAPQWVEAMLRAHGRRPNPGIVCGRTIASDPTSLIGSFHDICGTLNPRNQADGTILYGCTCNLSIDTAAVSIEFDTDFSKAAFEDVEFCFRARKTLGVPFAYAEGAVVFHRYPPSLISFFQRFMKYGAHEGVMCGKHPEYPLLLITSAGIPSIPIRKLSILRWPTRSHRD